LLLLSFFYGCSTQQEIIVEKPQKEVEKPQEIRVGWNFFPNPNEFLVREGKKIVFEITLAPETEVIPEIQEKNFLLDFGDDSEKIPLSSEKMDCLSGKCKFFEEHTYKKYGFYKPRLRYKKKNFGKKADDLKLIIVDNDDPKLIIVDKDALTDKQLEKEVQEQMLNRIMENIKLVLQCNPGNPMNKNCQEFKLAITISRNANFEYDQGEYGKKDLKLVNTVTEKLVKSRFRVIEKHPQVLIRLAHESVVRSRKGKKKEDNNERVLNKDYLDHLEYSLTTSHESSQKPFVYNIKIEGVNDKQREQKVEYTETAETEEMKAKGTTKSSTQTVTNSAPTKQKEKKQKTQGKAEASAKRAESDRLRPFLFARFSTATNLLVVDRVQDVEIKKIPYYSSHYKTYTHRRIASVKVNARLLNRDGSIIWMENKEDILEDTNETIMPITFVSK